MPLTNKQLGIIHQAKAKLDLDDMQYRGMLLEVAGVASAKALDQKGFEKVMAWFEKHGGWQGQQFQRSAESLYCSTRQQHEMEQLAAGRTTLLEKLTTQMSGGYAANPSKLRPWQAGKVIEALKAMTRREIREMAELHPSDLHLMVRTYSHGTASTLETMSTNEMSNLWRMLKGLPIEYGGARPEETASDGVLPPGASTAAAVQVPNKQPPLPVYDDWNRPLEEAEVPF